MTEGDVNPLVIDIGDNLSCYEKWAKDRLKYYRSNKYMIDCIRVRGEKCVSVYEYLVEHNIIKQGHYDRDSLRKIYIEHRLGHESYEFERKMKFRNYPLSMFGDVHDFDALFTINHDFTNIKNDQGSIIDYNPITIKN